MTAGSSSSLPVCPETRWALRLHDDRELSGASTEKWQNEEGTVVLLGYGYGTAAKDYNCYQCGPGRENWYTETGRTLENIVKICDWDIITIQEHTGTSSAWYWDKAASRVPELTEKAAVEGLVAKIKAACPNKDVKIYYLLSLAYGKGSSLNTDMDLTRRIIRNQVHTAVLWMTPLRRYVSKPPVQRLPSPSRSRR